ncbi:hypothetical protein V5O48_010931 [Marasmius crinis-equi]|uniref:non-reducing end alpha-L-arabinofuranosidase n=1 Tax=Marasmius crinis-equi TaxID=585013 RepID=A0ABR3F701_9AGAR
MFISDRAETVVYMQSFSKTVLSNESNQASTTDALKAWKAVNGAQIAVIADSNPVSNALPNSLTLTVPDGSSGAVGVSNEGYFGIKVSSDWEYTASFHYRTSFTGDATINLQTSTGQVLGSTTASLSGDDASWKQVSVRFTPTTDPDGESTDNLFVVTVDGEAASGQVTNFALFSLFPPTFNRRANGLRKDIAETLQEMKPAFFRFVGGNNLEVCWFNPTDVAFVLTSSSPPRAKPPRGDGNGMLRSDPSRIAQDVKETGATSTRSYSLGGTSIAEDQLDPYIQQAADQINFVIGDPAQDEHAALRASLGHPEPFKLRRVEVGNEDFIGSAPSTYGYRWKQFVEALQPQFPDINFIATTHVDNPVLDPTPAEYDVHVYQTPKWFYQNAFYYDGFARNGTKYFEGEYAVTSTNSSDIYGTPEHGRLLWPTMQGSSAEAAFMTGLERNSDIVYAAGYAPLLNHVNNSQWTPNLVSFDAARVYRSTSFYVQKVLFGLNRGDEYLPSTLPDRNGSIHWAVARKGEDEIIIKIANAGEAAQNLTFALPFDNIASTGNLQVLTGPANASNTPDTPDAVTPRETTIATGKTFDYEAPGYSVTVVTFTAL